MRPSDHTPITESIPTAATRAYVISSLGASIQGLGPIRGPMAQRLSMDSSLSAQSRRCLVVALMTAGVVGGLFSPTAAASTTFTVEPTQIFLSARTSGVLLTLMNGGTETLRFELSAFSWTQSPTGEVQLAPTEDIVFFPSLLTVGPGESRKVRVGSVTGLDVREKTYRIFVEELPPNEQPANGVRVLTKMGIPIFIRPTKEIASATLNGLGQRDGKLHFALGNSGTVHFVPKDIRVHGFVGASAAFENVLAGWYVLAGGRREFEMEFPQSACSKVTSVVVNVQFGSDTLEERLQTPNGVCSN